jgi:hypothetical protein
MSVAVLSSVPVGFSTTQPGKSNIEAARERRIKYFWTETKISIPQIGRNVLLPARKVTEVIESHPEWERSYERNRVTGEEGMAKVLAEIKRCIAKGEALPNDRELAYRLNHDYMGVQSWFKQLTQSGVIRCQRVRVNGNLLEKGSRAVTWYRVVTLVATGEKTPTPSEARKVSDFERMVEAAENYVRRLGPTVYDANVRHPNMAKLEAIYVDRELMSLSDFLAYAITKGFHFGAKPRS